METSSLTARLCSACGLCCNGVMFHTVRIQPSDSAKELAALGLRLKRKKGADFLVQPCAAFRGTHCAVYEARPERCRRFECRQLKRVVAGEITEVAAMEKIRDVQRRAEALNELLDQSGKTDPKKPLSKRYEKIIAEPEESPLRESLTRAFEELDAILDADFRVGVVKEEDEAP